MPRLELCAALTGAQFLSLLHKELTLLIHRTLWTDSTTVLSWLKSESCRFKVFVGSRVMEIQVLMHVHVNGGMLIQPITLPMMLREARLWRSWLSPIDGSKAVIF